MPSVEIPESPDMQPLLSAYATPTANVGSTLMAEWDDPIVETRQAIEESALPEQLLALVEGLQEALHSSRDAEGVIEVNGHAVEEPNGVIRLNHVCSGWDEDAEVRDPNVDGSIDLTATLQGGSIAPVVWGAFHGCRWKRALVNRRIEASYDGEIQAHFGESFYTDTVVRKREITFAVTGALLLGGTSFPIRRSFRIDLDGAGDILDGRLDVLIETEEQEHFVFFFRGGLLAAGIEDATGRFFCSLEERRCDKSSGSFFW